MAFAWPLGSVAQVTDPSSTHSFPASQVISGRYIVVFKPSVENPAQEAAAIMRGIKGQTHHVYAHALKGFAATLPDAALQAIQNNPNVASVEADATVRLNQVVSPQNQATWGLDRIDQVDRPLDTQYRFNYTGAGVTAFIIDTGMRADHVEFTGRVGAGYTAVSDGNGTNDCNGHGTHVSGTVGGTTWGVAKAVKLVPVRVLDCAGSGSLSGVIAGIDWVAGTTNRPAVANLSLGSSYFSTVNAAVAGAVSKGITMVVAAGNSNANACNYSPASEPAAITVGATTSSDARASYSNYGSCLDIFAPGSSITSAWITSSTATNTISGTSMASPHVAGVASLALQANPLATPAAVANFLTSNASLNKLSSVGTGSPNKLVYSLAAGAPGLVVQQTVAIKNLTGKASKTGKNWQATVTATVRDVNSGNVVANAVVAGSFVPGGSTSCVTASTGSCALTLGNIPTSTMSITFTVSNITGANMTYSASQNTATQVTVTKP